MGATSSSLSELPNNEYLKRLSSQKAIDPMDPFWNQLLSFSFQIPVNRYQTLPAVSACCVKYLVQCLDSTVLSDVKMLYILLNTL